MMMKRNKGRRDFTQRLINYAIEGGALSKCAVHPKSIFKTNQGVSETYTAIEKAWQSGEIGSDLSMAQEQLEDILVKAPTKCSIVECWTKD